MTVFAQVAGCIEEAGEVRAFVSNETAQFWTLYIGEPGAYEAAADFEHPHDALEAAETSIAQGIADVLDDRTFTDPRIAGYLKELKIDSVVNSSHLTLRRLYAEHGPATIEALLGARMTEAAA